MSLKKKLKKAISSLVPKGYFKEKIKLFFYNLFPRRGISFEILKQETKVIYKTTFGKTVLLTNEALYPIADDFNYYQHFCKTQKGDVTIDAGANLGHISIFLSKQVGEQGKVYCFEPDKYNIERLQKNRDLNPDLPDNIIIQDVLLWNENAMVDFEEAGTVGSSAVWFSERANIVKKQAVTLDSWAETMGLTRLDFIKMDIEGAEIEALDGCIDVMKKFKPNFAIASYHIVNGAPTYIKVEEFFKKMNYPHKTVTFRGNEIITFAGLKIE
ncbi:FkbM family methyltransferase [Flavobacterium sedimenticola]|uniref:FkbM family methyltransferase n=1 Tax=Flavobacterium sedimenticola TaxID=3043286 RepID=A0ABT6XTU7_9FLAO|nr:FkbM family methyltransferase [Flavobacterium sedimenticola]MDI9258524.1 FkbM family methyltransferase [Flavobacterium sedimenticola]